MIGAEGQGSREDNSEDGRVEQELEQVNQVASGTVAFAVEKA